MFDLRKLVFLPQLKANRPVVATFMVLVLTGAGGRAFAQDTPPEPPAAAPTEAAGPQATVPVEAPAPKPATPSEGQKQPPAPPPAPCPEAAPPVPPAPPVTPAVEWKAQSKGGFNMTSGNSQATNVTFGVKGSRKEGNNKLELEAGVAYGRSKNLVADVDTTTTPPTIIGVHRDTVVSTNNWATKGRYDRFLTENNVAYASTQWAGDQIAGKTLFGGGQAGYSRQVRKDRWNLVLAELGYDFSYERYVQQAGKTIDPVTIHSARILVGETLTLTKETGVTASVEALLNLNPEGKAFNASNGNRGVDRFHDTRVNGKVGISTNLFKKLALGVGFTLKYDQNPAPLPVPAGAPAGSSFPTNYVSWAFADKVDTLTEVTLLYSFF